MSDIVQFAPIRAWDRNGIFVPGATAEFYDPGTTTPRTVYSDSDLTTAHAWPLVADARGGFPSVYTSGLVKVIVKDAGGVVLPGFPMDPAPVVSASSSGAATVSFAPNSDIPDINTQAAIERVQANQVANLLSAGLGVTGNAALLSNLDSTGVASGLYRFDMAVTTGTPPSAWGGAETGAIAIFRGTGSAAIAIAMDNTSGALWFRPLSGAIWGSWVRIDSPALSQATWNAGTDTTEATITPAKLAEAAPLLAGHGLDPSAAITELTFALDTAYQNTTGFLQYLLIKSSPNAQETLISPDGTTWTMVISRSDGGFVSSSLIPIPPGWSYKFAYAIRATVFLVG